MTAKRILIVDDHPAMRQGLALLIEKEADLTVCGEAGSRREALDAVRKDPPDLVVLDLLLGEQSATGLDLIGEINALAGPVPILVFSMCDEMFYAERALRAGARGYLTKQEPVRRIITAIRRLLEGDIYVGDVVHQRFLSQHVGPPEEATHSANPLSVLSKREFEVFRLIGEGCRPRDIARILQLSVKTIEAHRANIRKKLDLPDALALARFAAAWRLQSAKDRP